MLAWAPISTTTGSWQGLPASVLAQGVDCALSGTERRFAATASASCGRRAGRATVTWKQDRVSSHGR
jgi:hypothetical protein